MLSLVIFVWERTVSWAASLVGNWEFLRGLWRAVAPLMAPWCTDREVPTCANLNFYGSSGSRVRWHSDDEGLFGKQGESKLIVSLSLESLRFSNGNLGPFWTVMPARPGCTMVSFWSWMVVVRTSILHCTDPLQGGRTGEYHFSVDQEPRSSVSSGRWGRVLPAHVREGFQHGFIPAGFSALG